MTSAAPLVLLPGQRNELELNTALVRRFQGIGDNEFLELTVFVENHPWVCHVQTIDEHIRALKEAERLRGYCGSYQLVNGPLDTDLSARYEPHEWHRAWNGRAADDHIGSRRALYFDVDPVRPKGISSTNAQLHEALEVSLALEEWLTSVVGDPCAIGHGCSGNGYFTLVAIQPMGNTPDVTARIVRLIKLTAKKFNTETVKLDASVFNAARLMPCPGTWKRKGRAMPERPHRMTTFICRGRVARIPLEALC
jgi:hypothetical protein